MRLFLFCSEDIAAVVVLVAVVSWTGQMAGGWLEGADGGDPVTS
jgi:hypothetical protein